MAKETKAEVTNLATTENEILSLDLSMFDAFKAQDGIIEGMEAMDASDIKMPRYKLLQTNSEEVASGKGKAGQFYNSVTGEVKDELHVALLHMNKSRVRFEKPYKRGASPACRSFDGKISTEGEQCASCPYADWDRAKKEGNDSPDCRESITWLFLEDTDMNGIPPRILVSGASRSTHSNFITQLSAFGYAPYIFKTKISSVQESNDKGIFFVMKFELETDPENPKKVLTQPVEQCKMLQEKSKQWGSLTDRFANYDTSTAVSDFIDDDTSDGVFA